MGLEALNPGLGERAADALASTGYVAALMASLVGPGGDVLAACPSGRWEARKLKKSLSDHQQVKVVPGTATTAQGLEAGDLDAIWLGATLPRPPAALCQALRDPDGRLVCLLGPRFARQDLVCLTRRDGATNERVVAQARAPIVAGPNGWLKQPRRVA